MSANTPAIQQRWIKKGLIYKPSGQPGGIEHMLRFRRLTQLIKKSGEFISERVTK